LIESRNIADNLVYTVEKTLKESGDKVSAEVKKEVEEKTEALKKVKDTNNTEEIKQKTQELSEAIQKVGAELYKQQGSQTPPNGENKGPEEGEYKEKK